MPFGRWVLGSACDQLTAWRRRRGVSPELGISVNLSVAQLRDPDLVGDVRAALEAAALAPELLTLEITESLLALDADGVGAVLVELKALGVQLAVDDFGTGYSSLSYLARFPLDVLKIDRSFVAGLAGGAEAASLLRSIIRMARSLRLTTVAEGIEDAAQLTKLRAYGADVGQGYHFAPPTSAAKVTALLAPQLVSAAGG